MEQSKIAMVQVAILYHEHIEKNINEFDELQFQKMCLRFGVDEKELKATRLMCKTLTNHLYCKEKKYNYQLNDNYTFMVPNI